MYIDIDYSKITFTSALMSAVTYVFFAIALYSMAKRRGLYKPWLAWVPIFNVYLLGDIADDICRRQGEEKNYRKILVGVPIMGTSIVVILLFTDFCLITPPAVFYFFMSAAIMALGIYGVVASVFRIIALYKIYEDYAPDKKVLFTVLSIFFGFLSDIFLFAIRNNKAESLRGADVFGIDDIEL